MSLFAQEQILNQMLENSEPNYKNNAATITLFCPEDNAFRSLNYGSPPLKLLQYHAVPSNISRDFLENSSSSPRGLKIKTLFEGHSLVKTTIAKVGIVSINNVKIIDWDIYNDGNVIVHGIESFFDPAFPILYPIFDQQEKEKEDHGMRYCSFEQVLDPNYWVNMVFESTIMKKD
ncbi:hypothetical protein M9H77_06628 [Catharanthus roseus]|uniref:Uncharacterized protein n=1 Tax=Catharanthus roseus TaxID=4058 RepID=A0ACC0BSV8_CATRO|nr:hypothetical protein M9H77_06628 [Catharanthus roseus]